MSVYVPPCVFGKSNDVTPTRYNFFGQQGWWSVPNGWFARRNADGTITGSPNKDFSPPLYDLKVNLDGALVFFSASLNSQAGLMSPAQR